MPEASRCRMTDLSLRVLTRGTTRLETALLLMVLTFLGSLAGARAQEGAADFYDVITRPGSALLEMPDAWIPVWCDARTIAFQRAQTLETGSRRWIEYHTLGEASFRTESLTDEQGGLLACSRGGRERVMHRGGYVWGLGQIVLVGADGREVELAARGYLVSEDRRLRTFVFQSDQNSREPARFELVTFDNTSDQHFPQSSPRVTAIVAPPYAVVYTAALSRDGNLLAYATHGQFYSGWPHDAPSLDLFLVRIGQSQVRRVRVDGVFDEGTRLDDLLFEGDRLVLGGTSTTGELVMAICSTDHATSVPCRMRSTGLDAREFKVAGLSPKGLPIIASRYHRVGPNNLRACLFELPEAAGSGASPSCRATVPVAETYGPERDEFQVLAPDRRHVAVLTRYRASPESPPPAVATWVVVPISEFQDK